MMERMQRTEALPKVGDMPESERPIPLPNGTGSDSVKDDSPAAAAEVEEVDPAEVFAGLYAELREAAGRLIGQQTPGHTLQPTALVNEAFLKLHGGKEREWSDDAHLLAVAGIAMRQVLVDHARRRAAVKRPPKSRALPLDSVVLAYEASGFDVLDLNDALEELNKFDPLVAQLLNCRFFLGESTEALAEKFGLSLRSLERKWAPAYAWLLKRLK